MCVGACVRAKTLLMAIELSNGQLLKILWAAFTVGCSHLNVARDHNDDRPFGSSSHIKTFQIVNTQECTVSLSWNNGYHACTNRHLKENILYLCACLCVYRN